MEYRKSSHSESEEITNQIRPAVGEPYDLPGLMEQAMEQVGSTLMDDVFCAKLLAYVCVLGPEVCVSHKGLNAGIQIAQQKANLYGGYIPKAEMLPLIQKYIRELNEGGEKTPWLQEIYNRYELYPASGTKPGHRERSAAQNSPVDGPKQDPHE
jgi:hypothetical protein